MHQHEHLFTRVLCVFLLHRSSKHNVEGLHRFVHILRLWLSETKGSLSGQGQVIILITPRPERYLRYACSL